MIIINYSLQNKKLFLLLFLMILYIKDYLLTLTSLHFKDQTLTCDKKIKNININV